MSFHDEDIHQCFFKTRHGLRYRILFVIREATIYAIHIRGPGQDLMSPEDVELPDKAGDGA